MAKDFGLKPQQRQVALSDDQLRSLWQAAGELSTPWSDYFRMLMLTGQRRSEVAGMSWGELDLDNEQV